MGNNVFTYPCKYIDRDFLERGFFGVWNNELNGLFLLVCKSSDSVYVCALQCSFLAGTALFPGMSLLGNYLFILNVPINPFMTVQY